MAFAILENKTALAGHAYLGRQASIPGIIESRQDNVAMIKDQMHSAFVLRLDVVL